MGENDKVPAEAVASSSINAIGYSSEREMLAITFKNGTIWHYAQVPADLAATFYAAESKGRFFAQQIRGKFPGRKMTGPCPKCGDQGFVGDTCSDCGCDTYRPEERRYDEGERETRVG